MIAASHINIWPMKWWTFVVAMVLAIGAIHGLYASSRKVSTTLVTAPPAPAPPTT
jgi:hypothetical protein